MDFQHLYRWWSAEYSNFRRRSVKEEGQRIQLKGKEAICDKLGWQSLNRGVTYDPTHQPLPAQFYSPSSDSSTPTVTTDHVTAAWGSHHHPQSASIVDIWDLPSAHRVFMCHKSDFLYNWLYRRYGKIQLTLILLTDFNSSFVMEQC